MTPLMKPQNPAKMPNAEQMMIPQCCSQPINLSSPQPANTPKIAPPVSLEVTVNHGPA